MWKAARAISTFDVAEVLASTVGYSVRDLLKPPKQNPRS